MEFIILLIFIVISIFIYNGFQTRCPNCGKYTLHAKDTEAIKEQIKMDEICNQIGMDDYIGKGKPNYTTTPFKCNSCKHPFDRKTALIWLTTANKLGEEIALEEYKKLKSKATI